MYKNVLRGAFNFLIKYLKFIILKFKKSTPDGRIPIFGDWDSFPNPVSVSEKKLFYSERSDVYKLARWILDSNGGSVLVSGARGAGKTAFVYYAIYTAIRLGRFKAVYFYIQAFFYKYSFLGYTPVFVGRVVRSLFNFLRFSIFSNKEIVFVPVNMASLEKPAEANRFSLLAHIIHSYFYSSDSARKNSEKLYLYSISNAQVKSWEKFAMNISYYGKYPLFGLILSTFVLLLLSFFPNINYIPQTIIEALEKARFYIGYILAIELFISFTFNWFSSREIILSINDQNFNYLQMEFQKILSKSQKIFVFVIDEIDKLDEKDGQKITNLLTDLKNLLTISSGRFIFITSDEYFDYLSEKRTDEDPYPITSTIFNWKIFLPQARLGEIMVFLKSIVRNKKINKEAKDLLELFSYYVYAKSGGIFSEVKDTVRDFIYYEGRRSYLNLAEDKFTPDDKRIARLGLIFNRIYEQRYTQLSSLQRYNYLRHQSLFPVFGELIDLTSSNNISITSLCSKHGGRGYNELDDREKELIRNDVRDLLSDIKMFGGGEEELSYVIPPDDIQEFQFSLTLSQIKPSLIGLSRTRGDLTETERELQVVVKDIDDLLGRYNKNISLPSSKEILNYLPENKLASFESAQSLSGSLSSSKYTRQDEIINRISELNQIKSDISSNRLSILENYVLSSISGLELSSREAVESAISTIGREKQDMLLSKSLIFKYDSNFIIITDAERIKRLWERIYETHYKPIKDDVFVITVSKDLTNDLIQLGFGKKNTNYFKVDNNFKGANELVDQVKKLINWKDVVVVPAEEVIPETVPSL